MHRYHFETDPQKICMLLDLYWCAKGGGDAVAILQANPGRVEMFHVEDINKTTEGSFTCPGYEIIDFRKIFAQAFKAGVKYYTVEIDKHPHPMQCI